MTNIPQEEENSEGEGEDDATSRLMQGILRNPDLRSALQSERVVRALEQVMTNPQSALAYLNDPEVGPVILQLHALINGAREEDEEYETDEIVDDEDLANEDIGQGH